MSRPVLPDHRIICNKDVLVEFTEEQVSKIRIKFGFDKKYPLEEKLHKLAVRFEKPKYYRNPPPKSEQEKLLKAIKKSASNLEESLLRVGEPELKLIGKIDTEWNNDKKLNEVSRIKHVINSILIDFEVGIKKGPRPRTVKKRQLIYSLIDIYRKGTGKERKYTQVPGTNKYEGSQVKFIEEIVGVLNAPVNNREIGEIIKMFYCKTA